MTHQFSFSAQSSSRRSNAGAMAYPANSRSPINTVKRMAKWASNLARIHSRPCAATKYICAGGDSIQVIRVDAVSHVTPMVDFVSIRNRATSQQVRYAMRVTPFAPKCPVPVTGGVRGSRPEPALSALINLRPKPHSIRFWDIIRLHCETSISGVMRQAVQAVLPLTIVRLTVEG